MPVEMQDEVDEPENEFHEAPEAIQEGTSD
jgi:hypothetical protein